VVEDLQVFSDRHAIQCLGASTDICHRPKPHLRSIVGGHHSSVIAPRDYLKPSSGIGIVVPSVYLI
jgi:hypothetical protein